MAGTIMATELMAVDRQETVTSLRDEVLNTERLPIRDYSKTRGYEPRICMVTVVVGVSWD